MQSIQFDLFSPILHLLVVLALEKKKKKQCRRSTNSKEIFGGNYT